MTSIESHILFFCDISYVHITYYVHLTYFFQIFTIDIVL